MPAVVSSRLVLWEVADIVEQIFRIAFTENLHLRPEEYDAATCDYRAEHGVHVFRDVLGDVFGELSAQEHNCHPNAERAADELTGSVGPSGMTIWRETLETFEKNRTS